MAQNSPAQDARTAADAAAKEGRNAADAVRDKVHDARSGAARTLNDARDMARDAADARVRDTTDAAAGEAERTAQAIDDAASDYPDGSMANDALSRVSGLLEDTAAGLRDTDLERVTSELQRIARRNPVLFLAGAAAVGFTAARLLRASDRASEANAWGGNGADDPLRGATDPGGAGLQADQDRFASAPKGESVPREERPHQVAPVGPAVSGRHA